MQPSLDPVPMLLRVAEALEALGVSYLVGGSYASITHGIVRSTLDVDFVADLHPQHIAPFVTALAAEFYADADSMLDAIQHRDSLSSFNLIHHATMLKVDVFILRSRPFDQASFARRRATVITREPERSAWVSSAEDIILAKLEWFRMGGETSERQWRDVLGVVKVQQAKLDEDYLREWAAVLEVSDLLDRALAEGHSTE